MKPVRWNACSACLLGGLLLGIGSLTVLAVLSKYVLGLITGFLSGAWEVLAAFFLALPAFSPWATIGFGVIFLAGVSMVARRWREARRWRSLGIIREEYEPLVFLLRKRGLETYSEQIAGIREKIFEERDKIEELSGLLENELPKIESRITDLSNQLGRPGDEREKEELRSLLRELIANGSRLRGRKEELEHFEKAKVRMASRLNCLRLKLLQEPKPESQVDEILQTIQSISLIEDAVEGGRKEEQGSPNPAS